MKYSIDVIRLKTAKAIAARCYEADKSSAMGKDGTSVHGNSIDVNTTHDGIGSYVVVLTSSVWEESTLKSLVNDAFVAINAHKTK
jgi:hypothetical protein